jgi:hypothetical protein
MHGIANQVHQKVFQNRARFIVDGAGNAFDAATASQATNVRLADSFCKGRGTKKVSDE